MKRVVTGIQPSGTPHIGNYFGMIAPALELASDAQALYFIADYHALTSVRDPRQLSELTYEVAATWLALGLDTDRSILYLQSDLPEVCELAWLLSCVTPKGLLNRGHAYKAAVQANAEIGAPSDEGVKAGLFNYPLLMAADILIHNADVVPVGSDNKQHVEIARDIAQAFNGAYGTRFAIPDAVMDEEVMTIGGTDGRKMSKSHDNVVPIFAEPDELRRRVMSIVTDSRRPEAPKDPDTCPLFALYRHIGTPDDVATLATRYRAGGVGYREVKDLVIAGLEARFGSARARFVDLAGDRAHLRGVLTDGATRARRLARPVLEDVRRAVGIIG